MEKLFINKKKDSMKIALYAHGGSGNHGCEAIVRSTIDTIGLDKHSFTILSEKAEEDLKYQLDKIASIKDARSPLRKGLHNLIFQIKMKLTKNDIHYYKEIYRNVFERANKPDLAIAIGGDNYCYQGFLQQFGVLNDIFTRNHTPIILWGCSIDPHRINNEMVLDLKKYSHITTRETITFQALKEHGLKNVHLIPDTAFNLKTIQLPLPEGFKEHEMVGINISPLISKYETKPGITLENYDKLIQHILKDTQLSIALIPHVVWSHNDDRIPLKQLYDKYKDSKRVIMIEDCNAMEQKGYISRCRFLIAARTHASIAGYSSSIPTLVVGYSVKAKGIATDLFGTDQNYVIPVNTLEKPDDLCKSFDWLMSSKEDIINHYNLHLNKYKERLLSFDITELAQY